MERRTVSVVGLGYAGLPVAVAFGRHYRTVGFDLNGERVRELRAGVDRNREFSRDELVSRHLEFTESADDLRSANFHIVAVPTPIDSAKQPDLRPLVAASETVGRRLTPRAIVVFESTVYPGVTEEVCVPAMEKVSGLKCGADFTVGYSPERINPGDTERRFADIRKVVSGQDEETLGVVSEMYGSVVKPGVFRAQSIRVAEAAKVIENTQRDLNIALMNELAIIFHRMGIDTGAVLDAAATKWNFMRFAPGLVGGHCVGIDPYYLTHKARELGYDPRVILAGRRINDEMGAYVAHRTIKEMVRAGHQIPGSRVTILGLTFKENCRDIRNTRIADILSELVDYGVEVQVCDPLACPREVRETLGISLRPPDDLAPAAALVLAVAHDEFRAMTPARIRELLAPNGVIIDVKSIAPVRELEGVRVWRL